MGKYKRHIVAFLDILGFRNTIYNSSFDEIMNIFENIISEKDAGIAFYRACEPGDKKLKNYNTALANTKIHIMSDSIIIASPDEYSESLAVVIDLCSAVQEQLYELSTPIFLRGAISVGDFYIGNSLLFGRAMVDAYVAQENYAIYPRIILSQSVCENRCVSVEKGREMPKDEDGYYYVDSLHRYLRVYDNEYKEYIQSTNYEHLNRYIEQQLDGYSEPRVREKYIWLRKTLENVVNYDNKKDNYYINQLF